MSKPAKPAKRAEKAWTESKPVNLRLDPEQFERLQVKAEAQARPLANMIKFALGEWLEMDDKRGRK